ncbi:MAG: hypothetical protein ACFFFH_00950 [Candidatus Thorarchaeota archaeon]
MTGSQLLFTCLITFWIENISKIRIKIRGVNLQWNRTTKYRKINWIDIGIAFGTITGAILGIIISIMVFANSLLGLFVSLILTSSFGVMIDVILEWLQKSGGKSNKRTVSFSKVNT